MKVSKVKKLLLICEHLLKFYDAKTLRAISQNFELHLASSRKYLLDASEEIRSCFKEIHIYDTPPSAERLSPLPLDFLKTIIEELSPKQNNLKIICTSELNMLHAAQLREEYNLGTPYYEDVIFYKSKIAMKEKLSTANIRCPQYKIIDPCENDAQLKLTFDTIKQEFGLPFILKPTDQSATFGVMKINNQDEFVEAVKCFGNVRYEAEEFINGVLFHADSLIQEGKIVYFETSQYLSSGLAFLSGNIHGSIPLRKDNPLFERIQSFTAKALETLGWIEGSSHLEVFLNENDELVFLEVSARPPGSLVVENYNRSFGINFLDEDLKIKLGIFEPLKESIPHYTFWVYFPWKAGTVARTHTPLLKSLTELHWFVKEGDTLDSPTCILDKTAQMFVTNDDYDILLEDFLSLKNFAPFEMIQEKM